MVNLNQPTGAYPLNINLNYGLYSYIFRVTSLRADIL